MKRKRNNNTNKDDKPLDTNDLQGMSNNAIHTPVYTHHNAQCLALMLTLNITKIHRKQVLISLHHIVSEAYIKMISRMRLIGDDIHPSQRNTPVLPSHTRMIGIPIKSPHSHHTSLHPSHHNSPSPTFHTLSRSGRNSISQSRRNSNQTNNNSTVITITTDNVMSELNVIQPWTIQHGMESILTRTKWIVNIFTIISTIHLY